MQFVCNVLNKLILMQKTSWKDKNDYCFVASIIIIIYIK
jgi:hypothetical protein